MVSVYTFNGCAQSYKNRKLVNFCNEHKISDPFSENLRIFVEEIFIKQKSINDKSKPKSIDGFNTIGRPEYVAVSDLIFGYLLKDKDMICRARILFKDLGYNFGGYFETLCDKAKKSI